ncbi:glycosyltransferase [Hymenobacter sp. UYCo722]|uniref:glycosyltransferase n=1 Tax=Hymenobacter sp. UYCo722 TaxID=3156335 RepID=UPI0033957396
MNPTEFSVLLLAWDDADPAVVVLGGAALPPTLPLVYQLAARHPVLAVYPHLPVADAGPTAGAPASAATSEMGVIPPPAWPEPGIIPNPLDADASGPGVHLLPPTDPPGPGALPAAGGSRLVGLDDLLPTIQGVLPTSHSLSLVPGAARGLARLPAAQLPTAARSQWPARSGPALAGAWQAPAAPYAGAAATSPAAVPASSYATVRESFPPPPPAPPRPHAFAEARAVALTPAAVATLGTQAVSAAAGRSDTAVPAPFDEPVTEMGAAEARDLDAPEDDLVPDTAPPGTTAAAAGAPAAAPVPAPEWAVRQPTLEGLNFRMIQYARQAAQLVDGRHDFDVIYAPAWPAWLAALEIRNQTGRPLVLYVPALASATAPATERGWLLGVERMALRRATLVLVPDAEVLRQLRNLHADTLDEVRIVPAADEATVQLVLAEVALG